MNDLFQIYFFVTLFTLIAFVSSLGFIIRGYPIVSKFLIYNPLIYKELRYAWILVSGSVIILSLAFLTHEFNLEEIHKILELGSALTFFSAFMLIYFGFKKFVLSLGAIKLYMKKNIGNYKVILVFMKGGLNTPKMILELATQASLEGRQVILCLGSANPSYFPYEMIKYCIYLSRTKPQDLEIVETVGDSNPTEFNLKLRDIIQKAGSQSTLIGDFIDTYLRMLKPDVFNAFWSELVGKLRASSSSGIFLVYMDVNSPETIAFLRRYADVTMDVESISEQTTDKIRIRITNVTDNISTGWISLNY